MARIPCRGCRKLVNVGTKTCPYCKTDLRGRPVGKWPKVAVLGFVVLMFVIGVTSDDDPPVTATTQAPPHVVYDETKWHPVPPDSKVSNSPWDGSVYEIERYLERTLKDPESYEGIEWSPVVTKLIEGARRYAVRHKYRAKNSFGGYVIEEVYFVLDGAGDVLSAVKL